MKTWVYVYNASAYLAGGMQITPSITACDCYRTYINYQSQHVVEAQMRTFYQDVLPSVGITPGTKVGMNFAQDIFASTGALYGGGDMQQTATERCQNSMAYLNSSMGNFNLVPALLSYSRVAGSPHQAVAQHIGEAWGRFYPDNLGDVNTGSALHRTRSAWLMDVNGSVKDRLCKPLYRPLGYQCDEYPFASVAEGGYYDNGDPNRYSVKMVPPADNESAGGSLNAMYRAQAVTDGEAFYVWVI